VNDDEVAHVRLSQRFFCTLFQTAVAAFLMAGTEHREDVAAKGGEVNETSAELEAAALASTAALPVGESHAATQKESDASEQSNSDTSEIASPSRPKVITAPTVLLTTMYQVMCC